MAKREKEPTVKRKVLDNKRTFSPEFWYKFEREESNGNIETIEIGIGMPGMESQYFSRTDVEQFAAALLKLAMKMVDSSES